MTRKSLEKQHKCTYYKKGQLSMKSKNNNIEMAIKHCRFMKDKNWRNLQVCRSLLEKELSNLSVKTEEELTKKDLLLLISRNCDYMRALNLYNYYKDELAKLLNNNLINKDND